MRSKYLDMEFMYKGGLIVVTDYRTISDGARSNHFIVKALDHMHHVDKGESFALATQTIRKLAQLNTEPSKTGA